MENVAFVTTQEGDDLVLSFAVQPDDDPLTIESLTLIRTPKYEFFFEEHERGVTVSFNRHRKDAYELLARIEYSEGAAVVRIHTPSHEYELNLRKVDPRELRQMCALIKKMNFDQKFQTAGV